MSLNYYRDECHQESKKRGWWKGIKRTNKLIVPVKLCLVHSEISEAMEGYRKDSNDDHLPHRKMCEVELVDALIRIFDLAGYLEYDLEGVFREKVAYNRIRADHNPENRGRDGGKKF